MTRAALLVVIWLLAGACERAETSRASPPRPAPPAPAVLASPTPRPAETAADDDASAPTALREARRRAREEDHTGAIATLDRLLASTPTDARALAMRGHQYLYMPGAAARAGARADLERAFAIAANDTRLGATIAFNLGLLEDREGDGARALEHYAAANRLRASSKARAHAAGTRECRITIREEQAPRDVVSTYRDAATRARVALESEPPEGPESEEDARAALCGEQSPCPIAEAVVGIGGGFDDTWANVIVPLGPERMRIVPGLLHAGREYQCTPSLDAEIVARGPWVSAVATLTRNEAVEEDQHGRACDPYEDDDCMRGCFWSRREVAHVFVRARDGLARVVIWSAPTPEDRAGEGRVAAYHEVDVERTGMGIRVRGCGVDRTIVLSD